MIEYGDFLTDKLREILKANLPNDIIVSWYDGDPIEIPQSALPAIAIETDDSIFDSAATGMNDNTENVIIKIITNKKDDFGKPADQIVGHRTLKSLTIGRDLTNSKKLHPKSIVGILLKNFTLSNNIYNNKVTVKFGVVPRPEAGGGGDKYVLTAEAHVFCALSDLIQVDNRT